MERPATDHIALDLAAHRVSAVVWRRVVVAHIANGLTSESDERHGAARELATELDGAGINVDREVDEFVDNYTDLTPYAAWKPPSIRAAEMEPPF